MDKIMALRKEINATYEKEGVKLSVNDFVIKAVALACKRVPECNSAWMETFIRWHKMHTTNFIKEVFEILQHNKYIHWFVNLLLYYK